MATNETNAKDQLVEVDESQELLSALSNNIPFKLVSLEKVRLEQLAGMIEKLRINLDLLCQALSRSPNVKSLLFQQCIFTCSPSEAAKSLGYLVQTHPSLETLILGGTLQSEGLEYFFEGLKYSTTLKQLQAQHTGLTKKSALALRESLRVNTTLEELYLDGASLNSLTTVKYVMEAIGLSKSLKRITLSNIYNGPDRYDDDEDEDEKDDAEPPRKKHKTGLEGEEEDMTHPSYVQRKLVEALAHHTTLTELKLSFSEILPAFGEILKTNRTLTSLVFDCCDVDSDEAVRALSDALKINTTLQKLVLFDCPSFADHWNTVDHFDALAVNSTLTELGMGADNISNASSEHLFETLKYNTTLLSLDIGAAVDFDAQQTQQLVDLLSVNKTLTKLDFFGHSENAHLILETLRTNTTLRALDFGANKLNDAVCKAFSETLKQNTTLQCLRLSDCSISDAGAKSIAQGLFKNTSLTSLDMAYNIIGSYGTRWICESLVQHPALTKLVYTTNQYDHEGSFGRLLRINTTLEYLKLDGGLVDVPSMLQLCNGLKVNTTLRTLESQQYCNHLQEEIVPCSILLKDALLENEALTSYEGRHIRVVDGIESFIRENEKLRRERITTILTLSHNIVRTHKQGGQIAFPIEVWSQIFSSLKYPGIKFSFSTMLRAIVRKYN